MGIKIFLVWFGITAGALAAEHNGVVKSNGLPIPGATVTASKGNKKLITTTDEQGAYGFPNLEDGTWKIEVEMLGFAKLSREVGVAAIAPSPEWELKMESGEAAAPSPAAPPARRLGPQTPTPNGRPAVRDAAARNGFQRLDVNAAADAAVEPDNAAIVGAANETPSVDLTQSASEALVVSGSVSSGVDAPQQNDWFGFGRGRLDPGFGPDGVGAPAALGPGNAGGGPGSPGRGGFARGGAGFGPGGAGPGFRGGGRGGGRGGFRRDPNAFGNARGNRRQQYNGNVALIFDNSALNARPFSLTGQNTPKPSYDHFRSTGMFGGPLKIPHLVSGQNTFFTINYQLARGRNGGVLTSLVPTSQERAGDFSQSLNRQTGLPVTISDPLSRLLFVNNVIPADQISPQAQALLSLYPQPNFAGSSRYNYQIPIVGIANQTNINSRFTHTINPKNQIAANFAWQSSNARNPNLFGFTDTNSTRGINTGVQWTYHFTTRVISNLRYNFSRSAVQTTPFFANRQNVSGDAGIAGNDEVAAFWGPPTLGFASGFAGLSDGNWSREHNNTSQLGENLIWIHGKHNLIFGGDLRRLDFNQVAQQNPRGSFGFTGAMSGFDFADFLLGYPDTSSIAFGNADKYFRASWLDAFVTDDWRVSTKLSLNLGLRWDYQSPVTELYGRLVNLSLAPGFTSATPVCATSAPGCVPAGQAEYPKSLVRPNYREFQPRLGLAWRPKNSTVVRAGYGIYFNTSVYQPLAAQMAQQAPLSLSVTQANSPADPYTLANAFLVPAIQTTPQTFGLDPNFRIGYLQYWQVSLQQALPAGLVATFTYNGNKGTHQVQQFLPNTFPAGAGRSPYPSGYVYETSNGNSAYNAGVAQLQRRFRSGLSGNLIYTFSKAIDDAQALGGRGGGGASYAQNWLDLAAERSLSGFNRTHTLNMNVQYSTGQGTRGGALLNGWKGALAKDWTFTTAIVVGSGLPLTPVVLNRVAAGTGITGTVRADLTGLPIYAGPPGFYLNPAAFTTPRPGQWGTAGRNIITGPSQFTLNASVGRAFRIGDRHSADLRLDSINALNHVNFTAWNTTVGSSQFGLPVSASGMRTIQATLRFRF